jgi:hypothetical protein
MDVYFADHPNAQAEMRGALSYTAQNPPGRVSYDPTPLVSWHVDVSNPDRVTVGADYRHTLSYVGATGSMLDLTHTGRVRMVRVGVHDQGPSSVSLAFPRLASALVTVDVTGDAAAISGTVAIGGTRLASISGTTFSINQMGYTWIEACQP